MEPPPELSRDVYTVGWVCVTESELLAARVLLDKKHTRPSVSTDDIYHVGQMGLHNVVIAQPVSVGKASAAVTAVNMIRSFQNIRFVLMVGTGGGATHAPPRPGELHPLDIFLGDVVVSTSGHGHGGTLQYDMGTQHPGGYEIKSHLNKPLGLLTQAANSLRVDHELGDGNMKRYICKAMESLPRFQFPGRDLDLLFESRYLHKGEKGNCFECNPAGLVKRLKRDTVLPLVHYGLIATADTLMRDAEYRDAMRKSDGVLCFEMEAAGLMDSIPCIIIRGISDYADSHKNYLWQPYASLTAAAYAKDLLDSIPVKGVAEAEKASLILERVSGVGADVQEVKRGVTGLHTKFDSSQLNDLMNWLGPLQFLSQQEMMLKNRAPTGEWLVKTAAFKRWVKGTSWQLRCHGEAGIGKTFLCAFVVDYLAKVCPRANQWSKQRPVIYLYLSDEKEDQKEQSPENLLGSLIKQLIFFENEDYIPIELRKQTLRQLPRLSTMKKAFEEFLERHDRTYLIIDGLSHCHTDVQKFVEEYLHELIREGKPLCLLTTSHHHRKVHNIITCNRCTAKDLEIYFNCGCQGKNFDLCQGYKDNGASCLDDSHIGDERYDTVPIYVFPREFEIANYCRHRLSLACRVDRKEDSRKYDDQFHESGVIRHLRRNPESLDIIAKEIECRAWGNFRVAEAWLDALMEVITDLEHIDDLLEEMAYVPRKNLNNYFKKRVENMKHYKLQDESSLTFRVISLIMTTLQPINIIALQHALALESDAARIEDRKLIPRENILRAANGMLKIDKAQDKKSFVRLIHDSMRVIEVPDLDPSFKYPHTRMANLCLKYLEHGDYSEHSNDNAKFPFSAYALEHWADHVRLACSREDDSITKRIGIFLAKPGRVRQIAQRTKELKSREVDSNELSKWLSNVTNPIHICAWYDLSGMIKRFDDDGRKLDVPLDHEGKRTPLQYACVNSCLETVETLLDLKVLKSNEEAHKAIWVAINGYGLSDPKRCSEEEEMCRVRIVEMILKDRDLSFDSAIFNQGRTVLMHTVMFGFLQFASLLLNPEAKVVLDMNVQDEKGRTALWHAAENPGLPFEPYAQQYKSLIWLMLEYAGTEVVYLSTGLAALENPEKHKNTTFVEIFKNFQLRGETEKNIELVNLLDRCDVDSSLRA